MQDRSWIMLRVLMNHFHGGESSTFMEGMNQEDQQALLSQDVGSEDAKASLASPKEFLEGIHYSWLASKFDGLSKGVATLALSALSEETAGKILSLIERKETSYTLSEPVKNYVLASVYQEIGFDAVLPKEYLPETPLKALAALKKSELVDLIDFLGLYDLSDEVRRLVDKNKLKQIYEGLTRKKHDFLRKCVKLQDKIPTSKLNLEHWDGDQKKLNKILHHRGFVRLGYALSGSHKDLIWHVTHTLDTGRGKKLLELIEDSKISGITDKAEKQVMEVIRFFKEPEGVKG